MITKKLILMALDLYKPIHRALAQGINTRSTTMVLIQGAFRYNCSMVSQYLLYGHITLELIKDFIYILYTYSKQSCKGIIIMPYFIEDETQRSSVIFSNIIQLTAKHPLKSCGRWY